MASSTEFVTFVCDQLFEAGELDTRKMFGEYCLYCNGKVIGLICDNQLFLKKTKAGAALLPQCEEASPYQGAKPHFLIEQLEDNQLLVEVVRAMTAELPAPKPKKPRQKDI